MRFKYCDDGLFLRCRTATHHLRRVCTRSLTVSCWGVQAQWFAEVGAGLIDGNLAAAQVQFVTIGTYQLGEALEVHSPGRLRSAHLRYRHPAAVPLLRAQGCRGDGDILKGHTFRNLFPPRLPRVPHHNDGFIEFPAGRALSEAKSRCPQDEECASGRAPADEARPKWARGGTGCTAQVHEAAKCGAGAMEAHRRVVRREA